MERPAKDSTKIQEMFSSIAHRYDLLNRLLSFGRDRYWRRFAISQLPEINYGVFLDVATGTADIAIEIAKRYPPGLRVMGVDFSDRMIKLGREKVQRMGYQERVDLCLGDATSLPFEDNSFEASIIAFGIRNVKDYRQGIREMTRVVKRGGKVVILEFTGIKDSLIKAPHHLYIRRILPLIGEVISGGKGAYRYLPASMLDFPAPDELKRVMEESGLQDVRYHKLTFGVTTVHIGTKPFE
jgi:demethylmenaquinone methyltransferase/2-methoxy-6-polyprenyl-1,4-benzoquinol methylase